MNVFEPVVPVLEPLCRVSVKVAAPIVIGPTNGGVRRIVPIEGGSFEGERLCGEVLPGGADWQIVAEDGSARLEARYTLRSHDGALIYVRNVGVRCGPRETLARIAAGEAVDPREYYFRSTPWFETGDARYRWLNDTVAIASAVRLADRVILDMYRVG